MLFVLVDTHSKWPEVFSMSTTTTNVTIEVLRKIFAAHGLPKQLVSDNYPQFTSDDFAVFMKENGVQHIRTAPYHPVSNGLAERFVQSVKMALKASERDSRSLNQNCVNFINLSEYSSCNHSSLPSITVTPAGTMHTSGPATTEQEITRHA